VRVISYLNNILTDVLKSRWHTFRS